LSQRLFIALWPDAALRRQLIEVTGDAADLCGGRAVPPENYHVTLSFLGDQPAVAVEALSAALDRVQVPAFTLTLNHYDCWPEPGIFWFGPDDWPDTCRLLVTRIDRVLDALDIRVDKKELKPHITLARKVTVLPELPAPAAVDWPVHDFVLVASTVTQQGSEYSIIRRFGGGSRHDPNQD